MADHKDRTRRFLLSGLCLSCAIDAMPEGKYPILHNVRTYQLGVIQPRHGQTPYISTPIADLITHSTIRLNDDLTGAAQAFAMFLGAGTSLYSDNSTHTLFTNRQSGFSGNPLSLIPFRPTESPEPFLYIGDSLKNGKCKVNGTFRNQGIFPPISPPTGPGTTVPSLNSFQFTTIDSGILTAGSWTPDGTVITSVTNGGAVIDTASAILFDSGTTGWAIVGVAAPFASSIYDEGAMVTVDSEVVIVDTVYKALKTTTVASITYDSGTSGLCTIQLSAHKRKALVPNSLVIINGENIRVLSVSEGADGLPSFRCSTTVNHTVGQVVTGMIAFRAFFTNNHVAGATLTWRRLAIGIGPLGILPANAPEQIGTATKSVTLNLGDVAGRPIQDEDDINFIMQLGDVASGEVCIHEVQLQLDCGDGTFTNYFYIAIRPSDIINTVTGESTVITSRQSALQRAQIDAIPSPVALTAAETRERLQRRINKALKRGNTARATRLTQKLAGIPGEGGSGGGSTGGGRGDGGDSGPTGGAGGGAGTSIQVPPSRNDEFPIKIKVGDVTRIGTDFSKGWADISSLRIKVIVSNPNPTPANVIIAFSSWWIGGSFGPDSGDQAPPYLYRYRYRASESGAKSYPSPATRSGVIARRQRVQLVATPSTDLQVDKIDWFRFGGTIQRWKYIGTSSNTSQTFNDDFPDDTIQNNEELDFSLFKPFPVAGLPITGNCSTSGTMVTVTLGAVSLNMAPGTPIIINSIPCTLYAPPISTTKFEVVENIGAFSGVSLFIPEPIIMGTPLPYIFGPYGEGELGTVFFAVGDPNNPGVIYYTNPDDPDSASDRNILEITSPSEPLLNGFIFDSSPYVFSSEELYVLYPVLDLVGNLRFNARSRGLGLGLAGPHFFCVGEGKIIFGSKDGIYITEGSTPISITDEDLYPLFPHDGQVGTSVNGYIPPDYTQPNFLRLAIGDSEVRFDYKGTDGEFYSLIYNLSNPGWLPDNYARQVTHSYFEEGRGTHRWLLGSTNGELYINSGTSDDGLPISSQVRTKSDDNDDPRPKKIYGDIVVDSDPNNTTIQVMPGFDNFNTLIGTTNITGTARLEPPTLIEIVGGSGIYARNLGLDITWSSLTSTPKLYFWSYSYLPKEEDIGRRVTDVDNLGIEQAKWIQGFRIRANTYNLPKSFDVLADIGPNGSFITVPNGSFTLTSDGESIQAFSFDEPFIAHLLQIMGTDNNPWALENYEFVFEPEPELVKKYKTQPTTLGMKGYYHLRDMYIAHISTSNIELIMTVDGTPFTPIIIPHGSGILTKSYIQLPPNKGKVYQFSTEVSDIGHRLYRRACEVRGKAWGSNEYNLIMNPFGDDHNIIGARI